MSYNSETGIISAPVSIDDVKQALGESSNDLATLCKSENINMWSRRKPVELDYLFPDKDGDWYKGDINDDYYNGKSCCGIVKNGVNLASFNLSMNTLYQNNFTIPPYIYYKKPSGNHKSPFRLGDFYKYNRNTPNYTYTGNKPYNENPTITLIKSGGGIKASASFTFNYNGVGDFIGLSEMFGGGDLYLGIIIEASSNAMISPEGTSKTLRVNPLSSAYIGDKIDGTSNNTTGLSYTVSCTTPIYPYSNKMPSETDKYFSTKEYIKVSVCVVKKNNSNNTWFFPIAYKWVVPGGTIDFTNYAHIENCKLKATITKMNDDSYWIYINKYDDIKGTIVAPSNDNSVLKFQQPLMFTPAEADLRIIAIKSSKLINESDKTSTSNFNAYNIIDWQESYPINTVSTQFTTNKSIVNFMFSFSIKSGIDKSRIYRATISMNLPTSRGTSTISDLLNVI
jgi:hypothetical protein